MFCIVKKPLLKIQLSKGVVVKYVMGEGKNMSRKFNYDKWRFVFLLLSRLWKVVANRNLFDPLYVTLLRLCF